MKKDMVLWVVAFGIWIGAASGFGQPQAIQPPPAYPGKGATALPQAPAVRPIPVAAQPVYYAPQPVQPVYAPPPRPLTLAPAPASAEEEEEEEGIYWVWGSKWPGIALGPKIGTTGIGLDLTFGVTRFLNLRSGFNYGSFSLSSTLGDVDYDLDVSLTSIPLLVDIQPFGGHFRITGGLYIQPDSKADINAAPTTPTQIGEHTYAPDVIGTLSGEITVADTVAPYLGIGFGNSVGEDQMLTFMMDIGVIFQSYDATLTANGGGMTTKLDTFRKDLALEESNVQKDVGDWNIFPVFTLGIAYHF